MAVVDPDPYSWIATAGLGVPRLAPLLAMPPEPVSVLEMPIFARVAKHGYGYEIGPLESRMWWEDLGV